MTHRFSNSRTLIVSYGLLFLMAGSAWAAPEPQPSAVSAFNSYVVALESHLDQQHRSQSAFRVPSSSSPQTKEHLRRGELVIEEVTQAGGKELSGALLHHWRGTAFVPGAKVADFERLMKDFNAYPQHFSPQVIRASVLKQQGDLVLATMRVRQKHVITVVMDTTYDIDFGRLDALHGYSASRSTRISEIEAAGTAKEHALNVSEEHGFLWRQNTYWSYEQLDGGLYMQIESVSLTRSIPMGLGWAVRPFVESVPRDSLEFTLRSTCNALRK